MVNESEFIQKLTSPKHKDEAFKQLLQLYQKRLYWHIRKLVITHENADDVLQNTFVRIFKSLPNFKQKSSLHTWMFKIAYNESLRFLEQQKKKQHQSLNEITSMYMDQLVSDTFFEGSEIQLKLQRILASLPEKQRHIFHLKYFDDLKFNEMETILGIKEGTIKTSYYKTVDFIKKNINKEELSLKIKV
ncbi:RNA polymerase sigma factor [Lutibacter holmesii]|uniref:RNA polymerase sigma factor n=1 Tax=Lutibacter holmesii TaxID=1137985 RepID=A0ABW3WQZ2_9FLAO